MRRAVITGIGVVSPFGVGRDVFFRALRQGKHAIGPIRSFDASTFPTQVAGEVPTGKDLGAWFWQHIQDQAPKLLHGHGRDWQTKGYMRDRKALFGLVAAAQALQHAGAMAPPQARPMALSVGLGLEQAFLEDFDAIYSKEKTDWSAEPELALPKNRFRSPVDLCARMLAEGFGLSGPVAVHSSACAAGTMAIAHGASLIRRGQVDQVLCGASDSMVNPLGVGGMSRLGAPSPRSRFDACRPFDRDRDGLVIGEGAAFFVLEELESANARGAYAIAEVLGWGTSQDAYKATAPRPDGSAASLAIARALARAKRLPQDIDYINAHGTGTPLNDPTESKAIHNALGEWANHVPVSSIKGAIGHLMAAAGAIEAVAALLPIIHGVAPGTAHHRNKDPHCSLNVVGHEPKDLKAQTVLSNSFGFGGQNAAIILGSVP